jgi:spore maturation protein CgeB
VESSFKSVRIIVAINKSLPRNGKQELDTGLFYLYRPLVSMGHTVYFWNTVAPEDKDFDKIVSDFKPDLIFCCFTGNHYITPYEPWKSIHRITKEGKIKTFNWFCDDTWRFDDFSSKACWFFTYCSTPEKSYLDKFRDIGYNNISLGNWYADSSCFPETDYEKKDIELSFVGGINEERSKFLSKSKIPITTAGDLDINDLFKFYCRSKIGINLSVNANDPEKKTQMKLRPFELAAAGATILTEYHPGIEDFFEIDKEILVFDSIEDFENKINYLKDNPDKAKEIASNGRKRFLKDHESKVRLKSILKDIS